MTTGLVARPIDQVFTSTKSSATEALDAYSDTTASGVASSETGSMPGSLPSSPSDICTTIPSTTSVPLGLPSIGSLGHHVGQCSRCCFHPKGRCINGYNCRFCHFDHDKRRKKKTHPMYASPTQNYGRINHQSLPATLENVVSPCTPP